MPRALSIDEKRDRLLAKMEEIQAAKTEPTAASDGATRKRRNAFNGTEQKIGVNQAIPGYHLHVLCDEGTRIKDALDSGYEFVTPAEVGGVSENVVSRNGDLGERIRYLLNPHAEGSMQYGYLMKQRLEWYEEDQAELQAKNNRIDAAIRKGKVTPNTEGFYQPSGGIKVQTV